MAYAKNNVFIIIIPLENELKIRNRIIPAFPKKNNPRKKNAHTHMKLTYLFFLGITLSLPLSTYSQIGAQKITEPTNMKYICSYHTHDNYHKVSH